MNNTYSNIKIWFSAIVLSAIISGCNKEFLEVTPKGKLIATQTNDYNLMLNNVNYIMLSGEGYLGDDVCAIEPLFETGELPKQRCFRYEDEIYLDADGSPSDLIDTRFNNLYLVNKVIGEVMDSQDGTEEQKKALMAEAKAFRACQNLILVNRFGKPYNPATAATDPAFPLIYTYDVTSRFTVRASVQEMYDSILSDFNAALPDLSPKVIHPQRFCKPAAEAMLAKVYFFMKNYDAALTHMDNAFNGLDNTDIPLHLNNYNETTLPGGIHQPTPMGPALLQYPLGDPECLWLLWTFNFAGFYQSDLLIAPSASALYAPSDLRFTQFMRNYSFYSNDPFPVPGMYQKVGSLRGLMGASLPEMYLMRAECRARGGDLGGAIEDLETLRKNRMPEADAAVPGGLSQDDLIRYVVDERIREFSGMGHRWYDMRRLHDDPLFAGTIGYTHTLYAADGSVKETYTLRPERFVYRIPGRVLNENPGLENNP